MKLDFNGSMTVLLCLVFFLSGVAALLFETLWFYQAGLTLGNSIWASSLVLTSFMGGLALGNGLIGRFGFRIRQPIRLYVLLEVTIGLTGLAIVCVLPRLTPLLAPAFRPFLGHPWILNTLRLAVAFPLLLIPSTAMGATLPLLVRTLVRWDPNFGRVLGRLYGWNTLGAVIGAVAGEVTLLERFGIRGTAVIAALLAGIAAIVVFLFLLPLDVETVPQQPNRSTTFLSKRVLSLLMAAFVLGGILLSLEVVWFRFLSLFVFGTSLTFTMMLSVVLGGIGLGGLMGSQWLSVRPEASRALPTVALSSGVACILAYMLLDVVARSFHGLAAVRWYEILEFGFPLMFPVSLLSGMLFTLVGDALHREVPEEMRCTSLLTLANTTGAMLGSLAGAFLLLPRLGI